MISIKRDIILYKLGIGDKPFILDEYRYESVYTIIDNDQLKGIFIYYNKDDIITFVNNTNTNNLVFNVSIMNKYFDDEIKEEIIEEIRPIIRDFIDSSIKYKDIIFSEITFDYKRILKLKKL